MNFTARLYSCTKLKETPVPDDVWGWTKVQVVKLLCCDAKLLQNGPSSLSRGFSEPAFCRSSLLMSQWQVLYKTRESQRAAQDFRALLNLTIQIVYASGRSNHMVCRGQPGMLASINAIFRHIKARSFATKISGRLVLSAPSCSEIKSSFRKVHPFSLPPGRN